MDQTKLKHMKLLGKIFPNIDSTCTEIINLQAILKLPKGTEHFLSDLHGEYEAFNHVLKNCSGVIKEKIEMIYSETLSQREKEELATVLYYPKEKIEELVSRGAVNPEWYRITINRIIPILKIVASKYSSSKVRKALPINFQYIIQEMIYEKGGGENRRNYISGIIESIVEIGQERKFIEALADVIQRLTIDRLHIVGDIYDRGPAPDKILDRLSLYHDIDIQWGNHDILWMGAAAGEIGCIANVVRICMRYGNNDTLDDGYGINLLPLASFAMEYYSDDLCKEFTPKIGGAVTEKNISLISKMHKAISVIQFKVEHDIIKRNPEYSMEDRNLLHLIDYSKGTITLSGKEYALKDGLFPTINPVSPYELSEDEKDVIEKLKKSFLNSERLQKHIELLYSKGGIFKRYNGNLLYHGCIPMEKDGTFSKVPMNGKILSGEALLTELDRTAREGFYERENTKMNDMLWYLWCGPLSPLFGKDAMKTFERYFIEEKETHKEAKNPYYTFFVKEEIVREILKEFSLDPSKGYIINGHVPVKVKTGESPIKAGGRLIIIDGGFSAAYRKDTGIAGYTLIYNSGSLKIVSHEPFEGVESAITNCKDILSTTEIVHVERNRITVGDTDIGCNIKEQIEDLKILLELYRKGVIKEKWD